MILVACGADPVVVETGSSAPTATTAATTMSDIVVPPDLARFGTSTVLVGGSPWLVAVADTPGERVDGLRGIDDMGDVDGMLFAYDREVSVQFTMWRVTRPLEIGFFTGDGVLFDVQHMVPCPAEPCPRYRPPHPFQWALETFPGGVSALTEGTLLMVAGG